MTDRTTAQHAHMRSPWSRCNVCGLEGYYAAATAHTRDASPRTTTEVPASAYIEHAIAVLRESAKQHRAAGDPAHGRACDNATVLLAGTMTDADRAESNAYYAAIYAA